MQETILKPVITDDGLIALANNMGVQGVLTKILLGEGMGGQNGGYTPVSSVSTLQNLKMTVLITDGTVLPGTTQIHVSAVAQGGDDINDEDFWINEVGIVVETEDENGDPVETVLAIYSKENQNLGFKSTDVDLLLAFDLQLSALEDENLVVNMDGDVELSFPNATTTSAGKVTLATADEVRAAIYNPPVDQNDLDLLHAKTVTTKSLTVSRLDNPDGSQSGVLSIDATGNTHIHKKLKFVSPAPLFNPSLLGSYGTPGLARDVTVVDNVAYVANEDSGLHILNVSDPTEPLFIGNYATSDITLGVTVVGRRAYVADGNSGLQILDIRDPSTPTLLGNFDTMGLAWSVDVVGDRAYVADDAMGLKIIDVSDPSLPILLGSFDTEGAKLVKVINTIAYIADSTAGLQIVDVIDPGQPTLLSNYDTTGIVYNLVVLENLVYLAAGDEGLIILDVNDPTAPVLLGSYDTSGNTWGIAVADNVAYLADGSAGLQIVDVSDPTAPTLLSEYDTTAFAYNVMLLGNIIYVADDSSGLQIIDISAFTRHIDASAESFALTKHYPYGSNTTEFFAARLLANYTALGQAFDISIVNNIAYIADNISGLQILDISNPKLPALLGNYNAFGGISAVDVVANTAYISSTLGLHVLDVNNPNSPLLLSTYNNAGNAKSITVVAEVAYVTDDMNGLEFIDVSDPSTPTFLGNFFSFGSAIDVEVVGNLILLAESTSGLRIINNSDPMMPEEFGIYNTSGSASGVAVQGNTVYVADATSGLQIVDITSRTMPDSAGSYATPGTARDVAVVGNIAYVADGNAGLQVLDISDTTNPVLLASHATQGDAKSVTVSNNLVYVVDEISGLHIFDLNPATEIVAEGTSYFSSTLSVGTPVSAIQDNKEYQFNLLAKDNEHGINVTATTGTAINAVNDGDDSALAVTNLGAGNALEVTGNAQVTGTLDVAETVETNVFAGANGFMITNNSWEQQQKLIPSDSGRDDLFGRSVAIDGDWAIIGANSDDIHGVPLSNEGSAYIFRWDGSSWVQQQKLIASDEAPSDNFGWSVSISGDYAIVGAYLEDADGMSDAGSAYVFHWNGSMWIEQQKLVADDKGSGDQFGYSVAIDGDRAIIGARYEDSNGMIDAGSAYVFHRSGSTWTQQQKLVGSDQAANDNFGWSVAIDGDRIVVGAHREDSDAGSAYVFYWNDTVWVEQQKLVASDKEMGDLFGQAVAIDNNWVIIGSIGQDPDEISGAGSAYLFHWDGDTWIEEQKVFASDKQAGDSFGHAVAIDDNWVVIGAHRSNPDSVDDAGSAYLFNWNGNTWIEQQKLTASDKSAVDRFGNSVSIDGGRTIIGSFLDDLSDIDMGSVYIFSTIWELNGTALSVNSSNANAITASNTSGGFAFYAALGGYGPFTGSHEAIINRAELENLKPGMLLSLTGQTFNYLSEEGEKSLSTTLPVTTLAQTKNDKRVFGVFCRRAEMANHWYQLQQNQSMVLVNALGDGLAWVSNINGDITAGDYITTSDIPGYGMKQEDGILHHYTLGKATEDVNWQNVTDTVEHNGQQYKVYLISLIYTSG